MDKLAWNHHYLVVNRANTAAGVNVFSVPTEVPAVERARWLAELSQALNEAHDLLHRLDWTGTKRADALEVHLRIEAARLEVESLRLSRSLQPRPDFAPEWTGFQPWEPSERERR